MKKWLVLLLVLAGSLISAKAGYCEQFATVMVDPVTVSIALAKGETKMGVYTVTNNTDEKIQVTAEPRYWFMLDESPDFPIKSWLVLESTEFEIEPRAKKEVTYTVKLPEAAQGELAVMIAFRPKPKEGQAINVVFSVSLYATLIGTEKVECDVSAFKIWKFEDRDALGMKVAFKNTGNIHVKPMTEVYVRNMFDEALQKAQLPFGVPVYPGKTQEYDGAIYGFKLKPGLYKAVIVGEYANVGQKFEKTVYVVAGKGGKILSSSFTKPEDLQVEPGSKEDAVPAKVPQEEKPKASGTAQGRTMTIPHKQR